MAPKQKRQPISVADWRKLPEEEKESRRADLYKSIRKSDPGDEFDLTTGTYSERVHSIIEKREREYYDSDAKIAATFDWCRDLNFNFPAERNWYYRYLINGGDDYCIYQEWLEHLTEKERREYSDLIRKYPTDPTDILLEDEDE